MDECIFGIFQCFGTNEKKKIYAKNRFGLLPKQYCGENILYFNRGDCIAGVYCNVVGLNSLSCIAIEKEGWFG